MVDGLSSCIIYCDMASRYGRSLVSSMDVGSPDAGTYFPSCPMMVFIPFIIHSFTLSLLIQLTFGPILLSHKYFLPPRHQLRHLPSSSLLIGSPAHSSRIGLSSS
ncbi:hypothetical protein BDV59DRAFT_76842 [Aspergillus ambiguus]|uniref:uncharacterized protein n=1 Tax=Aspergillus ambiguus TaxID=176160 RepID=UPI003CCD50EE